MKANPGGAPGNFLAALSKYGLRTAFLGKVGTDAFGGLLINTCLLYTSVSKGYRPIKEWKKYMSRKPVVLMLSLIHI